MRKPPKIAEIWRRISEDYAPFDVDVTTEAPASFGPTVGRILITRDSDASGQPMPAQGAGGVAYVNVWGISNYHSYYSPALVYYNNLGGGRPDYVSEAASHEMGHNMGLSHDGTSTASYYGGHGSGFTSWGPIMGTGYNRNVSQWSKGEYADANQQQDDVAIIASKVNLQTDDHGNQTGQARPRRWWWMPAVVCW
ncbi:zinc-dependent metalloprotease family protein [Thiothrix nivea]|uniref:zinc-dependent metalloprotease family protein n=1 Tax=Thiothrix nivea TaxID=1031 RepID=UPI00145D34EB|nr:zinc-dependent metalloprotease family protein [Thiothrix nivea]